MPNKLSADKKRLTYTEFPDVAERLGRYAARTRMDRSLVIRNATNEYVRMRQMGKFKPAAYNSDQPRAGVVRISYAEWGDIEQRLRAYASDERRDLSEVLREAVHTYLRKLKQ